MNLEQVKVEGEALLKSVKDAIVATGKRIPLHAAWTIVQEAAAKTVIIIETNIGNALSGPEKKAAAMLIIGNIIAVVLGSITLPYVPLWIQNKINGYVNSFLLEVASGSIDALVSTFHDVGVFPPKPPTSTGA